MPFTAVYAADTGSKMPNEAARPLPAQDMVGGRHAMRGSEHVGQRDHNRAPTRLVIS